MTITRRRLISICAAWALVPAAARAAPGSTHLWMGLALGARTSLRLAHPDAEAIAARVMAELERLESILSLYRPHSALSRLNRDGQIEGPPFELLECLSLAGSVHRASGGRFDPTVQPLWALWAEAATQGAQPDVSAIATALRRTGWNKIDIRSGSITLQPGMALTLNGIGQGYVADRVAALLEAEGLTDILIDTGEMRALGGRPDGGDWPVRLESGERVPLRERALATSAPLGTTFDQGGRDGHILDPRTGRPSSPAWRSVSITAPSAALADALTTAACLMPDRESIDEMLRQFPGTRLDSLS